MQYPLSKIVEVSDQYHNGKFTVADPYRWLEDPDSAETKMWVNAQNRLTASYLDRSSRERDIIRAKHEQRYNYGRMSSPMVKGSRTFVYRNTGLQNQDVLFDVTPALSAATEVPSAQGLDDEQLFQHAKPLIDLNTQFPDGTVALSSTAFSEDGRYFAYALSRGGSDWITIYLREVATGKDLLLQDGTVETVPWAKFTRIAWLHDGSGFFYCRYPSPPEVADAEGGKAGTETGANKYAMVCFHAVGTHSSEDLLVYANPAKPNWRYGVEVSDDGAYLLLSTVKGTDPVNRLYYQHLPTAWGAWKGRAQRCAVPPGGVPPAQPASYLPFVRAFDSFEGEFDYLTNDGPRFYLKTNLHAPRYRVVACDLPADTPADTFICAGEDAPGEGVAVDIDAPKGTLAPIADVVPQAEKDVLDWATVVAGRHLVTCYLRDVCHALSVCLLPPEPRPMPTHADTSGETGLVIAQATEVPLPAPGTIAGWSGRRDQQTAFLKFVSFLHSGAILKMDFSGPGIESAYSRVHGVQVPLTALHARSEASSVAVPGSTETLASIRPYWSAQVPGFDASRFEARQVFVPSKDGKVHIPMFIVRKKGGDGATKPRPALLYFYGGFNISLSPNYSSLRLTWLEECEGVWCLANIRGGGEYGEEWHEGGCRHNKTNCFEDAAACGEWLVQNGYTTPRQLGIMGGSNGGLGVLATAQRYPAHWGAVVSQVPVTDMLRFHKFTIGAAWRGEYGFAEEKEEDFVYMRGYSPLHNCTPPASEEQQYPSILITTGDHDDRVVPLHSHKMTARLQAVVGSSPHQRRPLLTRIETQAGHGAGKPTSKVLDEYADVYAFLARELGAEVQG